MDVRKNIIRGTIKVVAKSKKMQERKLLVPSWKSGTGSNMGMLEKKVQCERTRGRHRWKWMECARDTLTEKQLLEETVHNWTK